MKTHIVPIGSRGTIRLPADLLRRHQLDEPGVEIRIIEHEDGSMVMHPIAADQRWFWTERWQAMEREADEDIAAGRVLEFEDADAFIAHLERLCDD